MYATPQSLRDRYRAPGAVADDFAEFDDGQLALAITSASTTIDSWLGVGAKSTDLLPILSEYCGALARRALYKDHALAQEHPIVADADAALTWLKAAGKGQIPGVAETAAPSSIAGGTRTIPDTSGYALLTARWNTQ